MRCRPQRRVDMDPGLLAIAERGRALSVGDYLAAYTARAELHNAMLRFHARYDLLLTPTMPVTALKVGREMPESGDFGDDWLNWSPYTYPFNLTQQPAASVPCGLARNGLPMGVQIVGPLRRGPDGAAGGPGDRTGAADAAAAGSAYD